MRRQFAKKNAAKLGPTGSILDVGCSTGDQLEIFREFGDYELFGVEYREQAAAEARTKNIRVW